MLRRLLTPEQELEAIAMAEREAEQARERSDDWRPPSRPRRRRRLSFRQRINRSSPDESK
jgi:hypothetical protein